MRRREFITLLGGAAGWPLVAHPQQAAMPTIGFLRVGTVPSSERLLAGLRTGLSELGYTEGSNLTIEYRWAENHQQLPALAANLASRQPAVIVASATNAAIAARDATSTIPIVFVIATDPVTEKLVASINRPGGNATGVTYLTSALAAKRLEFVHQIVPAAKTIATLVPTARPSHSCATYGPGQ